jgi:hypothetical protein
MIILKETSEPSVAPGTYLARCFRIVDAGTHSSELYGDKRKLIITWELPSERIEVDGKDLPKSRSKWYTLSLNKKATLRADLECWRGRAFTPEELAGFELAKVLGTACQLTIVLNEKGQAIVKGVSGVPRGTIVPETQNPKVEYSFEQGPDEVFKALPEWLQKAVGDCQEWQDPDPVDPKPIIKEEEEYDNDNVPF